MENGDIEAALRMPGNHTVEVPLPQVGAPRTDTSPFVISAEVTVMQLDTPAPITTEYRH